MEGFVFDLDGIDISSAVILFCAGAFGNKWRGWQSGDLTQFLLKQSWEQK